MGEDDVRDEKIKNLVKEQAECKKERITADNVLDAKIDDWIKEATKEIKDVHWKFDTKFEELSNESRKSVSRVYTRIREIKKEIYEYINKTVEQYKTEEKEAIEKMNGAFDSLLDKVKVATNETRKWKDKLLITLISLESAAIVTLAGIVLANFTKIFT